MWPWLQGGRYPIPRAGLAALASLILPPLPALSPELGKPWLPPAPIGRLAFIDLV